MEEYDFVFNRNAFEVFPPEIYNDPLIVFHGTAEYHSEEIENNGFNANHSPISIEDANELIELLRNPQNQEFLNTSECLPLAKLIEDYVNYRIKRIARTSFSALSYACTNFCHGSRKGGQIYGKVRKARELINNANNENVVIQISDNIENLFNHVDEVANTNGVIYAVRLNQNLQNIQLENDVIFSSADIPQQSIVGKVIIPIEFEFGQLAENMLWQKVFQKLKKGGFEDLYDSVDRS